MAICRKHSHGLVESYFDSPRSTTYPNSSSQFRGTHHGKSHNLHSLAQSLLTLNSTSSIPSQTVLTSFATTMSASDPTCRLLLMDWHPPTSDLPLPTCRLSRWLPQPTLLSNKPPSVLLRSRLSVLCGACSRHLQHQCSVLLASSRGQQR